MGPLAGPCSHRLEFGGLKIRKDFIELILDGRKVWEIRRSFGAQARKYLNIPLLLLPACRKRTSECTPGTIMGVVRIVDFKRISPKQALKLVATIEERNFVQSKYGKLSHVYALRLGNPARFPTPVQLPDPIKAQTWVCNFGPRNRKVIKRALRELNYL